VAQFLDSFLLSECFAFKVLRLNIDGDLIARRDSRFYLLESVTLKVSRHVPLQEAVVLV
jgi:hypothetical protein